MCAAVSRPTISVILPVYREASVIAETLRTLRRKQSLPGSVEEVIVVDANSGDGTTGKAESAGARVVQAGAPGRARQMNEGGRHATGQILYFLHADTVPPDAYDRCILDGIQDGYEAGCFRLRFDDSHPLLRLFGWCTRFDLLPFRYGDQSLFVKRAVFQRLGGFRESLEVMEDNEFIGRLRRAARFSVLPREVTTSARKYRDNGVLRLQLLFALIFMMYYLGAGQETLTHVYGRFIRR